MHNHNYDPNVSLSSLSQQDKLKLVQQTGMTLQQLLSLQQPPKRQTRARKDPIFYDTIIKSPQFSSSPHELNSQPHPSPATSTTRTQNSSPSTPKKQPKAQQSTPKVSRAQDPKINKQISIPKSSDQFYPNYITFSNRLFKDNQTAINFIETYKKQLFDLFTQVANQGGLVKIISQGYKNEALSQFVEAFKENSVDAIFEIYKRYLLHFEYQILENYTFKEYHDAVPLLGQAVFVDESQLRSFLDKTPLDPKYFEYDIMVFKNGQNAINIDSNAIHLDRVAKHYKDYNIDIRIQKAMDYGFKPRTMRNEPYQMKISHYRIYQKLCQEYAHNQATIDSNFIEKLKEVKDLEVNGTTFKERVNNEEIFFGVNFDPDDGLLFDEINEKVDGTFLGFKQQFDLLSYLDQQVPGCSFPQFYFKVKGVWTGGHQENINMCAVNINHGPDASQWYSMEWKYVEQFRVQLKKEFKMDLYGSQGLWYEKINWFIEQGKYPVKKIIQKKGDIVVSGPGTLHWVRSYGIALQSAWNQFPITLRMMEYAFCRQQENQKINFIRSNTIPLKILTLKLLNHQPPQLTTAIQKLCVQKVKMWIKREEELFQQFYQECELFPFEHPRFEPLDDIQGFCTKCKQEILIYFVNGKKVQDIVCLGCYKKQSKNKKKNKRIYMRNTLLDLKLLVKKSEIGKPFKKIKAFISQFVGKVSNEIKNYKMDKQSVFIQKVNEMNAEINKCDAKKITQFMKKLKNKRYELEEKQYEKQPGLKQKFESMDLQGSKVNEAPEIKKIEQQKLLKNDHGQVKKIGEISASGWWDFQIPQHLRIVTQKNHVQLLKYIHGQQIYTIRKANRYRLPRVNYSYFIIKSNLFDDDGKLLLQENRNTFKSDVNDKFQSIDDPKFSSDQEEPTDTIRKKVHKNQDFDKNQNAQVNNKSINEHLKNQRIEGARSRSNQSRKSKNNHKENISKSSRSNSNQRQRKQHKNKRQRSSKSPRKQSFKHSQSKRSRSGSQRSKSRGKSSRQQSHRGDEQISSRNGHQRRRQNEEKRNNYSQVSHRNDRREKNDNRNREQHVGHRRDKGTLQDNDRNQQFDRRQNDYRGDSYKGNNYRGNGYRDDRGGYQNRKNFDNNNNYSMSYNNPNPKYDSRKQQRNHYDNSVQGRHGDERRNGDDKRQGSDKSYDDDRKHRDHNQKQSQQKISTSNKIVQENFDY